MKPEYRKLYMDPSVRKALAWLGMIGAVVYIAAIMVMSTRVWWSKIPAFFLFMSVFLDLVSQYLKNRNKFAASKLNTISMIFGGCFFASLIFIAFVL